MQFGGHLRPQAVCLGSWIQHLVGIMRSNNQDRSVTHSVINLFHAYKSATLCQALCWAQRAQTDEQGQRIWDQGGQVHSKHLGAGPEDINQN